MNVEEIPPANLDEFLSELIITVRTKEGKDYKSTYIVTFTHNQIICGHNRKKDQCKECGGSQIRPHKRRKAYCKKCWGSQICMHRKNKNCCSECKPNKN